MNIICEFHNNKTLVQRLNQGRLLFSTPETFTFIKGLIFID